MENEQKYQDKLREMIAGMLDEKTKDEMVEKAAETNENIAKILEQNTELKTRLEAIEKMPAQKVNLPVPGKDNATIPFMYKGYDLRRQGARLDIPADRKEAYAKFFIDCIKTSMNEGTGSQGGYLVPEEWSDYVMAFARQKSVVLQDANIVDMGSDTMNIPGEATNVSVTWTDEAASLGQSDPTFSNQQLIAQRLGAFSVASNELLMDEKYDLISHLTSQFAEAIAKEIDNQAFNGGTFTGALSGCTTNTVTCASSATSPSRHIQITHDELSQAIAKLTSNKLDGAKYYIHQNSLHYIRVEQDTAGNPIFAMPGGNVSGTIYEYPYVVASQLPAAPEAASGFIIFGNLKYYNIGRRVGTMTLEVDPYGLFVSYQTRFRVVTRWDGKPGLEAGLVIIKTHA